MCCIPACVGDEEKMMVAVKGFRRLIRPEAWDQIRSAKIRCAYDTPFVLDFRSATATRRTSELVAAPVLTPPLSGVGRDAMFSS